MENQNPGRRIPLQARAKKTVSFIFEAAVLILEEDGLDALTTNAVAARAGVSIGTLYQYFPNREALLEALAQREIAAVFETLARLRDQVPSDADPEERLRLSVRALLSALDGRLRARRALVVSIVRSGQFEALLARTDALTAALLARTGAGAGRESLHGFVLSRSVGGVLRGALLHDEETLRDPAFEDALVRLIGGFLKPRGAGTES